MPKKIILVRHGETDWNFQGRIQGWFDAFLNETGRFQARLVYLQLKEEKIDYFFSSDLARAYETVEIIAKPFGKKPIKVKELRERMMGKLQGMGRDEFRRLYPDIMGRWWDYTTTDKDWKRLRAETDGKLRKRLGEFIRKLERYRESVVLVGLHGGSKRMLLEVLGCSKRSDGRDVRFKNTAITILVKSKDGKYKKRNVKSDSHLCLE